MELKPLYPAVAATALALAALGAGAVAQRHHVGAAEHDAYAGGLRRLVALDYRLNEILLRAEGGLTANYDDLSETVDAIAAAHRAAEHPPGFVDAGTRAQLTTLVATSRATAERQAELVERFKSTSAILRNSVRYFPTASEQSEGELGVEAEATANEVRRLRIEVLRAVAMPWQQAPVEAIRTRVKTLLAAPPGGMAARSVIRHAQVVADRTAELAGLMRELLGLPAAANAVALDTAYTRQYQRALAREAGERMAVSVLVLAAVAAAALAIILRLRKARDQLALATTRLERAVDMKNRFVSMTSHEFRTPLSVILSSGEMLETYAERWDASRRNEHLRRIQRHARAMTELLDGLLLVGRADAGLREFKPSPTEVDALLEEVVEAQRPKASGKVSVELTPTGVTRPLMVDPRLLRHILDNLVSNGIKYTREGGTVKVLSTWVAGKLELTVEDSGIGIPKADLERLFESFHRGANVQGIPGTGLGLAIVARAVEQHGGQIEVTSEVGRGTRFHVTLPAEAVAEGS